jgi:hypothetical protein
MSVLVAQKPVTVVFIKFGVYDSCKFIAAVDILISKDCCDTIADLILYLCTATI